MTVHFINFDLKDVKDGKERNTTINLQQRIKFLCKKKKKDVNIVAVESHPNGKLILN